MISREEAGALADRADGIKEALNENDGWRKFEEWQDDNSLHPELHGIFEEAVEVWEKMSAAVNEIMAEASRRLSDKE